MGISDEHRVTAILDEESYQLLRRISRQERRSQSSTILLLILREASSRGMLARAPALVVRSPDPGASDKPAHKLRTES